MYEGNAVDLQMEKVIAADAILDDETHHCQVFRYDMEEDYIYLQLKEDDLTAISLDAKYQCYISTRTELLFCTGRGYRSDISVNTGKFWSFILRMDSIQFRI